jgi:hypothetical protein
MMSVMGPKRIVFAVKNTGGECEAVFFLVEIY